MSDEEIRSLAQEGDLEKAQKRISTGGDFAAWLIALGGQFCSGVTSDGVRQKTIGADFAFEWIQHLDSTAAASLAMRVLGDDLPGIGIVAARMAENDGTFLYGNLIPAEDGGYYIISFDALTDEWKATVEADRIFPETFLPIWVDGFAGITAWCQSADNPRGSTLTQAFYIIPRKARRPFRSSSGMPRWRRICPSREMRTSNRKISEAMCFPRSSAVPR